MSYVKGPLLGCGDRECTVSVEGRSDESASAFSSSWFIMATMLPSTMSHAYTNPFSEPLRTN